MTSRIDSSHQLHAVDLRWSFPFLDPGVLEMVSPCVLCLTSGYQIETSELSGLGISACSLPPPPLSFSLSLSLLSRLYTAIKSLRNTACVTSTSACLRSAPVGFDSSSPLAPKTTTKQSVPSCIFQRGDSSGSASGQ